MMRKWIFVAAMIVVSCDEAAKENAAGAKSKEEKIIVLLEMSGALDLGRQMAAAMSNQVVAIWKSTGNAPNEEVVEMFMTRLGEEIDKEMKVGSVLVSEIVGVYSKHYSEENIDDLIRFYGSETGKKVVQAMPTVVAESMAAGQKWGQEKGVTLAREVVERIRSEGFVIPEI